MAYSHISLMVDAGVARLTMARPERLNALSPELMGEMLAAIGEIRETSAVQAMVLTGSGSGFCAGADLVQPLAAGGDLGEQVRDSMAALFNPLAAALAGFPKPLVAAVNGVAAGGGVGLALAADVTLASQQAIFHLPFLPRLGLVPDMGVLWLMAQRIGAARARSLCLFGDPLPAALAHSMGLVQGLLEPDELDAAAMFMARRLSGVDAAAFAAFRRLGDGVLGRTFEDELSLELELQAQLASAPAFAAGVAAFRARRGSSTGSRC